MAEKTPSWTPYRYAFNNPLRYIDPKGMTEEERKKAVNQAQKFVKKNPNQDTKLYDPTGNQKAGYKGGPGEATDCSGLVSNSVQATGLQDPNHGAGPNGVTNIVNNTTAVATNDAIAGNIVTFKSNYKDGTSKAHTHVGLIESVDADEKTGNVISITMLHSGKSSGPIRTTFSPNTDSYYGRKFEGVRSWDTPDPVNLPNILIKSDLVITPNLDKIQPMNAF